MAKFIGTIQEFITIFGDTLLTKAVEAYTKEYRKMVGHCQDKGRHGIECSRTLQAAHNHEAGYDRKGMAIEILKEYENAEGIVEVDIYEFLKRYHDAHQPLHKTVKILCSRHHGKFDEGTRTRSANTLRYGMPEKQIADRGSCPLEFVPSEEAVIEALKSNGKCYIHYHILGGNGTVVTKDWNNTKSEITGANLHNNLRSKQFVKDYRDRIEKIVVSIHKNPEA